MKTLYLTVTMQWFALMVTGEKDKEYRKPSKWIFSRLWRCVKKTERGNVYEPKEYEQVKITAGYGKDKPYFIAKYLGNTFHLIPRRVTYSDGSTVDIETNDIAIDLGEITEIGNYDRPDKKHQSI